LHLLAGPPGVAKTTLASELRCDPFDKTQVA
jgi:broad-specificity NMP kinase